MLCPQCGTNVGDISQLCPRCAADAARIGSTGLSAMGTSAPPSGPGAGSPGSTSLGAIKPAVKVVRLAPGESRESYLSALEEQKARGGREDQGGSPERFGGGRASRLNTAPRNSRNTRPLGFFLVFFAVLGGASAWIISHPDLVKMNPQVEESPPAPLSHIVIREKKEIIVDGHDIVGMLSIDQEPIALTKILPVWNNATKELQLAYGVPSRSGTDSADRGPIRDGISAAANALTGDRKLRIKPEVIVSLRFAADTTHLDVNKLRSYTVSFNVDDVPILIQKEYSKQLAAFGEVSQLSGNLKPGETVRGSMRDERTAQINGRSMSVVWQFWFEAPLIVRAQN